MVVADGLAIAAERVVAGEGATEIDVAVVLLTEAESVVAETAYASNQLAIVPHMLSAF